MVMKIAVKQIGTNVLVFICLALCTLSSEQLFFFITLEAVFFTTPILIITVLCNLTALVDTVDVAGIASRNCSVLL